MTVASTISALLVLRRLADQPRQRLEGSRIASFPSHEHDHWLSAKEAATSNSTICSRAGETGGPTPKASEMAAVGAVILIVIVAGLWPKPVPSNDEGRHRQPAHDGE